LALNCVMGDDIGVLGKTNHQREFSPFVIL
jgi:hypothetical protein